MSVELTVSGEELRKAMEMVALVGSMAGGKKKDDTDVPGQNVLRIIAMSPKKDKRYLIALGTMNIMEQVDYFFEGKSYTTSEPVEVYLELKRFAALARTFTGDVSFIFDGNEIAVSVGSSKYTLTALNTTMPALKVPDGGIELASRLLEDARNHCSVVVPKNDGNVAMMGIQIKFTADGNAVCWGANRSAAAKLVLHKTGVKQDCTLLLKPECMKHISDFAEGDVVRIVLTDGLIFACGQRFNYRCNIFNGTFPACEKMESGIKEVKRIRVVKSRLLSAVVRAGVMAGDDEGAYIKICSDAENIYVEGMSVAGTGIEQVALESSEGQDDASICFPADKLVRLISNCLGEELTIGSNGATRPFVLRSTESENFYVIMPVRAKG